MQKHHKPLLFSLILIFIFLASFVIAENLVSWNVPGTVFVVKPELNLKLYNDPDGTDPCKSLSWTVVIDELNTEPQAKYLKNVGSKNLSVWWVAELPTEINLTVSWYDIAFSNGEWTPTEKGTHPWASGESVFLAVEDVIVVTIDLHVNSNVTDGDFYSFSLTFTGSG